MTNQCTRTSLSHQLSTQHQSHHHTMRILLNKRYPITSYLWVTLRANHHNSSFKRDWFWNKILNTLCLTILEIWANWTIFKTWALTRRARKMRQTNCYQSLLPRSSCEKLRVISNTTHSLRLSKRWQRRTFRTTICSICRHSSRGREFENTLRNATTKIHLTAIHLNLDNKSNLIRPIMKKTKCSHLRHRLNLPRFRWGILMLIGSRVAKSTLKIIPLSRLLSCKKVSILMDWEWKNKKWAWNTFHQSLLLYSKIYLKLLMTQLLESQLYSSLKSSRDPPSFQNTRCSNRKKLLGQRVVKKRRRKLQINLSFTLKVRKTLRN